MDNLTLVNTVLSRLNTLTLPVYYFRPPPQPPTAYVLAFPSGIHDEFKPLNSKITLQVHRFQVDVIARAETVAEALTALGPSLKRSGTSSVPIAISEIPGPVITEVTDTMAWKQDKSGSWFHNTFQATMTDYSVAAFPFSPSPLTESEMTVYSIFIKDTDRKKLTEPPLNQADGVYTWSDLGSIVCPTPTAFKASGLIQFKTKSTDTTQLQIPFDSTALATPTGWAHINQNQSNVDYAIPAANEVGVFAKVSASSLSLNVEDTTNVNADLVMRLSLNHWVAGTHIVQIGRNGPPPQEANDGWGGGGPIFEAGYTPDISGIITIIPLATPPQS